MTHVPRVSFDLVRDQSAQEPPGTPRVTIIEGTASVSWRAARGAKRYKVLCADLERGAVGYLDVDGTHVRIENLRGRYRLDLVAFGDRGASAPKQLHFASFGHASDSRSP